MSSSGPRPDPRTERLEELVFRCLEAEDPESELAALRREHPELESRVLDLLDRLRAQGLLDDVEAGVAELPDQLGPFRLLRPLGSGGMGVVYLAEQEGLGRRVALKLIRPEQLYFPGSKERFRREVEAVARLQHRSIVPVYTVGEENGLPYFAMEYVPGGSVADVVHALSGRDPAELSGKDLASIIERSAGASIVDSDTGNWRELFERPWVEVCTTIASDVAEALAHAHERGVLHRDVKPSNVLIGPDGRARLVDFGLARTEGAQRLTHTTAQLGSLPYLPPEQLDAQTRFPSARQDVYSLGVTLYEMLALEAPYLGATVEETRQRIVEGSPRRLRECNRAVSWDLDTVCWTAMEPDPAQRYADVPALMRDLDNLRYSRPIEAKRPSAWIRLRRWEQRHPTMTAVAIVGVLLIAAAAVSFAIYQKSAREEAQRLTTEKETARASAEQRAAEANQVSGYLVGLFSSASPRSAFGEDTPVRLLLNQTPEQIEAELEGQPAVQARLFASLASVYGWLSELEKAIDFYRRAIEIRSQLAGGDDVAVLRWRAWLAFHLFEFDKLDEAYAVLDDQRARAIAAVGEGHWLVALNSRIRGSILQHVGQLSEAEQLLRDALTAMRPGAATHDDDRSVLVGAQISLADLLHADGRYEEAQACLDEAHIVLRQHFRAGGATWHRAWRLLARNRAALGQHDEAERVAAQTLEATENAHGEEHPIVARVLIDYGWTLGRAKRHREGLIYLERALAILAKYEQYPAFLARALNDLGNAQASLGRFDQARAQLERAVVEARRAYRSDRVLTVVILTNLSATLDRLGRFAEAEEQARAALEMVERIQPRGDEHAELLVRLAWILIERGRDQDAAGLVEQSIEIANALPGAKLPLGRAHLMRALLCNKNNDADQADLEADQCLALLGSVYRGDYGGKAMAYYNKAWSSLTRGDREIAEKYFRESIEMFRRLSVEADHPDLSWPLNHYGFSLLEDRPKEAVPMLEEALRIRRSHLPRLDQWRIVSTLNLAYAYYLLRDYESSEPLTLEAHEAVVEIYGEHSREVTVSVQRLSKLYRKWGKTELAAQWEARIPK